MAIIHLLIMGNDKCKAVVQKIGYNFLYNRL